MGMTKTTKQRSEMTQLFDREATACPRCRGAHQRYDFGTRFARRSCQEYNCRWSVTLDTTRDVKAKINTVELARAWWVAVYG